MSFTSQLSSFWRTYFMRTECNETSELNIVASELVDAANWCSSQ